MAAKAQFVPILLLLSFISVFNLELVAGQKTWCVAKPSTDEKTLQKNIDFACSHVDCSFLQRGCPCWLPDSRINHASFVMNLYYQANGRNYWNCDFSKTALVTTTDPSYDSCAYQ